MFYTVKTLEHPGEFGIRLIQVSLKKDIYVAGQNEIPLSLNPNYSWIMNNWGQKTKEIENQTTCRLKSF